MLHSRLHSQPDTKFSTEEQTLYYQLMIALSKGDFDQVEALSPESAFHKLTPRFNLFLKSVKIDELPPDVKSAVETQIPMKAFVTNMLRAKR